MRPKQLYLTLAIIGSILPYYFLIYFLLERGPDISAALGILWESNITRFFVVDVLLTVLGLLVYLYFRERQRPARFWLLAGATVLIGPSCALPLCLYFRERDQELSPLRPRQPEKPAHIPFRTS